MGARGLAAARHRRHEPRRRQAIRRDAIVVLTFGELRIGGDPPGAVVSLAPSATATR
jgi:hypothetical protein